MLSIIADALMTAARANGRKDFPDHLKDSADRYVRSPRAERNYQAEQNARLGRNLW